MPQKRHVDPDLVLGLHPTDPIEYRAAKGAGERAYTPTYPQSEAPTAPFVGRSAPSETARWFMMTLKSLGSWNAECWNKNYMDLD